MKKFIVAVVAALGLMAIVIAVIVSSEPAHDAGDFSYWMKQGADKDWAGPAAKGNPEAQFQLGLSLIRTNLVMTKDQVPGLAAIPVLGKRYFKKVSYRIDSKISPVRLAEADRWIKKSAAQGFAPAREAEKLFLGKFDLPRTAPSEPR